MLKAAAAKAYQSGLALIVGAAFVLSPSLADARRSAPESADSTAAMATVTLSELPREGRSTYTLILRGGPFAHDKDGTVFGNRERILPRQSRGYYREYTVRTPGSRDRGARRIVAGSPPETSGEYYYTDDHYRSFRRIKE